MIRKPEPKEAAKAIVAMFSSKGIIINRALALEVVATVEGFNDWNTMSAALQTAGIAKVTPARKETTYPDVDDDDGPFLVQLDGRPYDMLERFKRAMEVAETFAGELDEQYFAKILDAAGRVRAAYVGDHSRLRTYYQTCRDCSVAEAQRRVRDSIEHDVEAQTTCFGHPENFYDDIVETAKSGIGDENMTFVLGYRVFETDAETGRVAHNDLNTPIQLGLLVVHGELRYVSQEFPADVRERISALLD